MQKVVGSNPIIRFSESPLFAVALGVSARAGYGSAFQAVIW